MSIIDPKCHVGEIHGIYELVDVLDKKDKYGHWIYKGICTLCGHEKFSHYGDFSGQRSIATVCNHVGANGEYINSVIWKNRIIGNIFKGMKGRCYNQNNKDYKYYGAKGIHICDKWLNNPKLFEEWSLQNGYENNLTIDRIDSDKDYCPENCRWVTLEENTINKPTTNIIIVDGEAHTGREWARIFGLGEQLINKYIRKYGLDKTIEFICKYRENPTLIPKNKQSYYDLYMNNNMINI